MLRIGEWRHPDAPGGKLTITKEMIQKIVSNFKAGLRDDVPVPLGHDVDAIKNSGHVVGLEADLNEGKLYGLVSVKDDEVAEGIEKELLTGGSALLNLNYVDQESGTEHGPTLIHWAITNAPYIKGLAPYEVVALGEDAEGATIIALNDDEKGGPIVDPIKEALEKLKDASDEDIRKALAEVRPGVLPEATEGAEPSEEDQEKLKEEGRQEVMAALSEKGIVVEIEKGDKGKKEAEVDVSKSPEFVALSEKLDEVLKTSAEKEANAVIDAAIKDGKVLPAQKEVLLEVALSEGGMDRLSKLIPEKAIVDLKEHGVAPAKETVELSEEDADAEADRYIALVGGKKEE